jgi:hypothetical protein
MAAICSSVSSRASTIWERPTSCRKRAFSGVRMSVWVLACSWIGGRSISSRPMSWMINASTPASYSCQASLRAGSSSSSRRMVLRVTKMRLLKRCAWAVSRAMSCTRLSALVRAPKDGPADVDRVGAVVHGLDADVGITRGGEQFKLMGLQGHGSIIPAARPARRCKRARPPQCGRGFTSAIRYCVPNGQHAQPASPVHVAGRSRC